MGAELEYCHANQPLWCLYLHTNWSRQWTSVPSLCPLSPTDQWTGWTELPGLGLFSLCFLFSFCGAQKGNARLAHHHHHHHHLSKKSYGTEDRDSVCLHTTLHSRVMSALDRNGTKRVVFTSTHVEKNRNFYDRHHVGWFVVVHRCKRSRMFCQSSLLSCIPKVKCVGLVGLLLNSLQ